MPTRSEKAERLRCGYLEALAFEIPAPAFQLDQLAFAKRSPVRGALEKEQ